eukprot:TRINITY_DN115258_c0_g1_i1.p1 TRINITY_DN115258_c0_g1~~TRINITY_DN115258_c0_g1_i1.p1  ORF type:complete len:717 (-),score=172.09 TRINITY_DN115258_c0_g1_i1:49-2199(-)
MCLQEAVVGRWWTAAAALGSSVVLLTPAMESAYRYKDGVEVDGVAGQQPDAAADEINLSGVGSQQPENSTYSQLEGSSWRELLSKAATNEPWLLDALTTGFSSITVSDESWQMRGMALSGLALAFMCRRRGCGRRRVDVKKSKEISSLTDKLGATEVVEMLTMQLEKQVYMDRPCDDYDLIVALDTVRGLNAAGCPVIACSDAAQDLFNNSNSIRTVGILGLYNTGKTFVHSELFGYNFPQGQFVRTRGLSMKWDTHKSLLIIDSAGNLEPVSIESSAMADAVRDKRDVESLTKELAVELSDFLIVVVKDITWPEQEFCQSLANRCGRKARSRTVIVVHNMQDIHDPAIAKARFYEQVHQCYKGEPVQHLGVVDDVLEFVHRDIKNDDMQIVHYGVANHFSPAGKMYNGGAFREMRQSVDRDKIGTRRCIKQVIQRSVNSLLPHFFYCIGEDNGCKTSMRLEFTECGEMLDKRTLGTFQIQHANGDEVQLRHAGVVNALGDMNTMDLVWEPSISITKERRSNEHQEVKEVLHVQIEAPGCTREQLNVDDEGDGLLVTINKIQDGDHGTDVLHIDHLDQKRSFGAWKRLFDYRLEQYGTFTTPANPETDIYVRDGIVHIVLPKAETKGRIVAASIPRRLPLSAQLPPGGPAGMLAGSRHQHVAEVPAGANDGSGDEALDARSRASKKDKASAYGDNTVLSFTMKASDGTPSEDMAIC